MRLRVGCIDGDLGGALVVRLGFKRFRVLETTIKVEPVEGVWQCPRLLRAKVLGPVNALHARVPWSE